MRLPFIFLISSNLLAQPVDEHEFHIRRVGHEDRTHLTFEPLVTWTYQHATKVLEGSPHAKAVGYYDIARVWTTWNDDDALNGAVIWGFRTSYSF